MTNVFGLPDHLGQRGSCIVCLHGTDTALAFRGSVEWVAAGLCALGVPADQAVATVRYAPTLIDGEGRVTATYQVCGRCAQQTVFPRPGLVYAGAQVPCVDQPEVSA